MYLKETGFTEPPPAMKQYPQCIIENNSVESYRNFYWEAKRDFAKWSNRDKPDWWIYKETGKRPRPQWWEEKDGSEE
jgi:hypothetical protein